MKLKKMVERAIEKYQGSVEIDLEENNRIKNIPVLIINGNKVSEGKVLTAKEITRFIKSEIIC